MFQNSAWYANYVLEISLGRPYTSWVGQYLEKRELADEYRIYASIRALIARPRQV